MKKIINPAIYPIAPSQINTSRHFWGAFGNRETEISANWIVRFCQARGEWRPFTLVELEEFYHANGRPETFLFNRLDADGFIVLQDGKYELTHEFVSACFGASAAI